MDKTLKTVLIIGGLAAAAGVGFVLYKKYAASAAVKQTAAASAANPLSSSGIQGYITGASGVLTALGNAFGAHSGTNVVGNSSSNMVHVGTNATDTGTINPGVITSGINQNASPIDTVSDDGSNGDNTTTYGN